MDATTDPEVVMLLSNCELPLGGTQKQAVSLAAQLARQGLSVSVVSKRQSVSKAARGGYMAPGPRREVSQGVRFVRLRASRLQPAWSFLLSFLVWAGANSKHFQIIHAHNTPVGLIACLVARLLGKKVVIKVPGMNYVEYLSGSSAPQRLRRRVLRRADRFVAVSTEMAAALRDAGIPPDRIALIPNGVVSPPDDPAPDRTALKRELLGEPEVEVVLSVGRLVPEKGLDRLLAAWASMPSRERACLAIVGDGPLKSELQSLTASLGLQASVRFLGYQRDVFKFYEIADLFVLSSNTEGMPNSLLEAMSQGVPVIAADVGGSRDVVEHRRSGFLVDWANPVACGSLIRDLLDDPALRRRLGHAARSRALGFAMEHIAERYRQLYHALLQERPA